ncbi:dTDP-4-amino-4,6-dideoxygalactose transaminase [Hoeflea sp. EC-HK425]|uniref:dTDP-4-amino-4,6-dideoxygalactose transaminase n=1 Tax=Hoeflea sp. EC-HK425 TaxID=2038388 RepID=UPI00125A2E7E|nr:dTDP-4-amino-4,6-dideoxygalactose transaminase [Hoeflea sp. EC-HK425]VVT29636.1 TDP-4-oxo-6-deoxy-D-glucose transaminase [Hoeflea sp. EC-HK425]
MVEIPFNKPLITGSELETISDAIARLDLSGDGHFTGLCEKMLQRHFSCSKAFLTHSCTAALEMAMLLLDLGPGDEVIMPSFTFTSTANAVVLRGATPIFADVEPGTMNIDAEKIEPLINPATKAIMVVHYAGRPADMDKINSIAAANGIAVVEDAAQAMGSTYKGKPAGTQSPLSALSFHETKNIVSGEGGALIVNDPRYEDRAAILREKGTNRQSFLQGRADKYSWVDLGSSYLPSELVAAFLYSQIGATAKVTTSRLAAWGRYRSNFQSAAFPGLGLPEQVSEDAVLNGHIFHLLLPNAERRPAFLEAMKTRGIQCTFHYVPLHSSPAGLKFGKTPHGCPITEDTASRLVRLPMFFDIDAQTVDLVSAAVVDVLNEIAK